MTEQKLPDDIKTKPWPNLKPVEPLIEAIPTGNLSAVVSGPSASPTTADIFFIGDTRNRCRSHRPLQVSTDVLLFGRLA